VKWIVGATVAFGVWGLVDYLFIDDAKEFDEAQLHLATGIEVKGERLQYRKKAESDTLVLQRGRQASTTTTAHGWWEILSIEVPKSIEIGKYEIDRFQLAYRSYSGRTFWAPIKGSYSGYIDIIAKSDDKLVANYNVQLEVFDLLGGFRPEFSTDTIRFEGNKVFEHGRELPDFAGDVAILRSEVEEKLKLAKEKEAE